MYDIIISITGFLIGVQLTMNLFAALYRVLDLWYCIDQQWPRVLKPIIVHSLMIALFYTFASGLFFNAILVGQIFFALFHTGIFWSGQLLLILLR